MFAERLYGHPHKGGTQVFASSLDYLRLNALTRNLATIQNCLLRATIHEDDEMFSRVTYINYVRQVLASSYYNLN